MRNNIKARQAVNRWRFYIGKEECNKAVTEIIRHMIYPMIMKKKICNTTGATNMTIMDTKFQYKVEHNTYRKPD